MGHRPRTLFRSAQALRAPARTDTDRPGMAWSADRTQKRTLHYLICTGITAIGLLILTALAKFDQPGAKYFATFILAAGSL